MINKYNNKNSYKMAASRLSGATNINKNRVTKARDGVVRLIAIGGTEEVGKNMLAIEINNKIIIIDSGAQHSASKMPGVDYIIPNMNYLEENKDRIIGIILTNTRLEHIGALPFLIEKIGHPPIYARSYTNKFLQKFAYKNKQIINSPLISIDENCKINIDNIEVDFVNINNSFIDNLTFIINTEMGDILYINNINARDANDIEFIKNRQILLTLSMSENSELTDWAPKENEIKERILNIIQKAPGRVIINAFPSEPFHILTILKEANKLNKKVLIESMPIKIHLEVLREQNLLKDLEDTLIDGENIRKYNDDNIIIFTTGPEGDELNYLKRIAENTHKHIAIQKYDTVLMVAHTLTQNQREIQNLKDSLSRCGAKIVHIKNPDMFIDNIPHNPNLKIVYSNLNTKFFIPIGGCHYMLRVNADIIKKLGLPENHIIIPENGMIIDIKDNGERIANTREKIDTDIWVVDGSKIGKVQNVVMKDRNTLSEQGVFFIIAVVDLRSNRLKKMPDIASRGFIYLKESQDILNEAKMLSKTVIEKYLDNNRFIEIDDLKSEIQSNIGKLLLQKTAKEPVIMPVIIKV